MNKALFLDRDGVIIQDTGFVHELESISFIDGIFDFCIRYQDRGFLIIVITNQSGVGRGYFPLRSVNLINDRIKQVFSEHGIHISRIYVCPHAPNEGCYCRKPSPGLFLDAIADYGLDPSACVSIGDQTRDTEAAKKAGVGTIFELGGNVTIPSLLLSLK